MVVLDDRYFVVVVVGDRKVIVALDMVVVMEKTFDMALVVVDKIVALGVGRIVVVALAVVDKALALEVGMALALVVVGSC